MVFSEEQKAAIHYKDGPALVLAGPGSGKTTVIVNRISTLIREYGVNPASILVITFTRAAAEAMKQRFLALTGDSYVSVTFGTFHAVFFSMLRHAYNYSAASIITSEQKYNYIRDRAISYGLEYTDETEMVTGIISEISCVKGERRDIAGYESVSCPNEIFRAIYKDYDKLLLNTKRIDYDDMILMCYELLKQRMDYRAAWQDRYRYILIDEFQDINKAQYDTIRLIAGEAANLFVVGDDDQSIYGFRGSRPDIMLGLKEDYQSAGQINLNVNYRCSSEIVAASRSLIDHNKVRFMKAIRSCGKCHGRIKVCRTAGIEDSVDYLIKEIKELISNGEKDRNIAVIARTNVISNIYYSGLMNAGIHCTTQAGMGSIYDYWIAKDIIAYLRLAAGQNNKENAVRIINKPTRYIKRALITQPFSYDRLRYSYDKDIDMLRRIDDMQSDMKIIAKMSPYAAINYILKAIGYERYIQDEIVKKRLKEEDVYSKLYELKLSAKNHLDIEGWLRHIDSQNKDGCQYKNTNKDTNKDANKGTNKNTNKNAEKSTDKSADKNTDNGEHKAGVNIYTMHSCKGLEFNVVFIMDVCEGIIPYNKAVLEKEIEEERRLMYVAMTRAKEKLYLIYPDKRYGRDTTVSRFIEEIDSSYIENVLIG